MNVEHRTSNVQRRTKKEYLTLNYFGFISVVLMFVTSILAGASVSSLLPIQNSMLDVRCSTFIVY